MWNDSKPVVIEFSLMTRKGDETYFEWMNRFQDKYGYAPGVAQLLLAPFPMVHTPRCKTTEKFKWCVQNFGLYNFQEVLQDNRKTWLFNDEGDAAMFKLRWSGVDENQESESTW